MDFTCLAEWRTLAQLSTMESKTCLGVARFGSTSRIRVAIDGASAGSWGATVRPVLDISKAFYDAVLFLVQQAGFEMLGESSHV